MKHILSLLIIFPLFSSSCQTGSSEKTSSNNTLKANHQKMNPYYSRTDTSILDVSNTEWKKILPDSIYQISREKETEYAFSGKYWNFEGIGTYFCAVCGNALFKSDSKFASSCGWPSFFQTLRKNSVRYKPDNAYGMQRTEVLCGRCSGHLGHLFNDGPPPTHKRFCMNSLVLDFEPDLPEK